jgi:hypothetical protein
LNSPFLSPLLGGDLGVGKLQTKRARDDIMGIGKKIKKQTKLLKTLINHPKTSHHL